MELFKIICLVLFLIILFTGRRIYSLHLWSSHFSDRIIIESKSREMDLPINQIDSRVFMVRAQGNIIHSRLFFHKLQHDSNRLRAIKIEVFFCCLRRRRFYSWVYCTSCAIVLVIYHKFVVHMPSQWCRASSLNRQIIENSNNMIFDSLSTWFL